MQKNLNKKRKGFTLIELIVVIAIIGILVLLAMPKFMDYTKEAKMAQIKHDVKVAETIMDEYLSIESKLPEYLDVPDMDTPLAEGRLFETRGVATVIIGDAANYRDVTTMNEVLSIKSKLPGQFVANENGNVYYIHDKAIDIGETLPDLAIAEDQLYMDESVPTLASVWGEDAKEVMAMVTALEGVGVSVPTQEDALNLYQDLKIADPVLLSKMIAVQPQIWTGNYSEAVQDLNSIKDGINAWLTGLYGPITQGEHYISDYLILEPNTNHTIYLYQGTQPVSGYYAAYHEGQYLRMHVEVKNNGIYVDGNYICSSSVSQLFIRYAPTYGSLVLEKRINYSIYHVATTAATVSEIERSNVISIAPDAPIINSSYDAETDRWYPEEPWLGAYSNTWQDVKMAKSGDKDIYLGTIDRYINDIVNVLTWDDIDATNDITYYGGRPKTTTTLTVTSDGLLEVIVPE